MIDPNLNQADMHSGQLEAILSGAVDAIITIDEQGVIQSSNPASKHLFGYDATELVGRNVNMLMPTPYHEEHNGYLSNYLRTGNKKIIGTGREVVGKRKDGSTFPMHLAVSEVKIGERRMFTGIVRDISDLKAAEQRLQRLNEELEQRVRDRTAELRRAQDELVRKEKLVTLGQVSGGIAHEIRNPLNAVKTSAYFLLNAKNPSPEKVSEHLHRIDRQVTLIDNVITALSDVAKMPEPRLKPMPIAEILRHIQETVSMPTNIRTILHAPDDIPDVMIDEHQIPIVFRNLFRNARDAMPEGGTLTVTVSCNTNNLSDEMDTVEIRIKDTGTGISPEDLERITEPLYSTKARGMGLGLAISLAILKQNHGSLEISSEPSKGSEFLVRLSASSSNSPASETKHGQ